MTTRERREAKADRLREWADKREVRAETADQHASELGERFAGGQPILAGHHSQAGAERDRDRMDRATRTRVESSQKAESFRRRASGIESQLDRAIYSDDEDAIEKLRERIGQMEAQREAMKAENAVYRKEHKDRLKTLSEFSREQAMPHPAFQLSNLGSRINRDRKRLTELTKAAAA